MRDEHGELRDGEHEGPAQQRDGHDRDDQGAGGPHRPADDLRAQIRQPGAVLVAPAAILEGGDQDPFVQIGHRARGAQRPQESEDPRAPADLSRAGRAALDVRRQPRGVGRFELVEQERVDQVAGTRAVQGLVAERVRHTPYMT